MTSHVYTWAPWKPVAIRDSRGPERVMSEPPPPGWSPPGPVGFAPPPPVDRPVENLDEHPDPVTWEGDQA